MHLIKQATVSHDISNDIQTQVKKQYSIKRMPQYFLSLLWAMQQMHLNDFEKQDMGIIYVSHLGPIQQVHKYIDDLLEAAAKEVEIDLPHNMVHEEIHRMIHQYEDHLKMQGLSLEQFLEFTHSTMEALEDQMHEEAEKRVTYRLMLEEIAKVEKIEITEEKAIEEAENLAEKYQMKKEEFLEAFGGIDMIKYDLTMRAAIDVLKGE